MFDNTSTVEAPPWVISTDQADNVPAIAREVQLASPVPGKVVTVSMKSDLAMKSDLSLKSNFGGDLEEEGAVRLFRALQVITESMESDLVMKSYLLLGHHY